LVPWWFGPFVHAGSGFRGGCRISLALNPTCEESALAMRIVVLGGYGVFGGRLARLLIEPGHDVVVAGRQHDRAATFCADWGGTPAVVDRDRNPRQALERLTPDLVVDAAGPFQDAERNGYPIARAALAAGADCLDLSDDAAFTSGIAAPDAEVRAAGRVVLSGVSTVPALSSAVVDALSRDLVRIDRTESAILPGNRAPRGLSVIRAFLAQAGRSLAVWRDGEWTEVRGWSDHRRIALPGLAPFPATLIGAPRSGPLPRPLRRAHRSVPRRPGAQGAALPTGAGGAAGAARPAALAGAAGWTNARCRGAVRAVRQRPWRHERDGRGTRRDRPAGRADLADDHA